MKNQLYTLLIFAALIISCKDKTADTVLPKGPSIEEEIDQLPPINAPQIEQLQVKSMDVSLKLKSSNSGPVNFTLSYNYDQAGKLTSVFDGKAEIRKYAYSPAEVVLSSGEDKTVYKLDENNRAIQDSRDYYYYYKNGFLVKSNTNTTSSYSYTSDGDLLKYTATANHGDVNLNREASYSYYDIENNIRQEVLGTVTFHWTFRDSFLGNYSTHLIKTAYIKEGSEESILSFTYEFDDQNRVSKVIIDREGLNNNSSADAIITYKLNY